MGGALSEIAKIAPETGNEHMIIISMTVLLGVSEESTPNLYTVIT